MKRLFKVAFNMAAGLLAVVLLLAFCSNDDGVGGGGEVVVADLDFGQKARVERSGVTQLVGDAEPSDWSMVVDLSVDRIVQLEPNGDYPGSCMAVVGTIEALAVSSPDGLTPLAGAMPLVNLVAGGQAWGLNPEFCPSSHDAGFVLNLQLAEGGSAEWSYVAYVEPGHEFEVVTIWGSRWG